MYIKGGNDEGGVPNQQQFVARIFDGLGFEVIPPENPKVMGGPIKYRVTDEALESLKGKSFSVNSDGTVSDG